MTVSIILTSYNRPHLLARAISSVKAQTYTDFQLIAVDDGSSDPFVEATILNMVEEPSLHLFLQPTDRERLERCRYAVAINAALQFAVGDYITYLTDDCFYLPQRLERMVAEFEALAEAMVVYGEQQIQHWVNEGWVNGDVRRSVGVTRHPFCHVDHNSIMHRRECLDFLTEPYWPEQDWHDGDIAFFRRLAEHWDFYPIPEIMDVHCKHPNSVQARMDRQESPIYTSEI